jgi:hypothetical protein
MGGWSERVMGQTGFFDVERRLEAISAKGDPLETIKKIVRWEDFRADIESVTETKPEERSQALQPLAQLRQKSPKASIVRGSLKLIARDPRVFGKRIPVAVNNFGCHCCTP